MAQKQHAEKEQIQKQYCSHKKRISEVCHSFNDYD